MPKKKPDKIDNKNSEDKKPEKPKEDDSKKSPEESKDNNSEDKKPEKPKEDDSNKKPSEKSKEIFEVKKDGEEKTIEKSVKEKSPEKNKNQIKKENTQLKRFFIGVGAFILVIFLVMLINSIIVSFEYEGVKFTKVKEGELLFYNTKVPIYDEQGDKLADYNFYIRNDPRELNVPIEGELVWKKNLVLNQTENLNCQGDGVIAIANLVKQFEVLGVKPIKDENATCDMQGRYSYISILSGNETKIVQTGPSCYDVHVNNCEILPATEKIMVENFISLNKAS